MASSARSRIKSVSYAKYGYMFIIPFVVVYCIFQLYPLFNTFYLSFFGNGMAHQSEYVGLENFKGILFGGSRAWNATHDTFILSMKNTVILWFGNFIPQICLSLLLAVWFTDSNLKIPGKGFFKVVMYLPNIITASSVAVLFLKIFSDSQYGVVNSTLINMGAIDVDHTIWFVKGIPDNGYIAPRIVIMGIQTWMWFGNTMIMLMSGIQGINPSIFEAANIDGANSGQVFFRITVPMLRPIMLYTLITSMIGGLQMFDIPYLYHQGTEVNDYVRTIACFIYDKYHALDPLYGTSAAASVILFIVTALLGSITFYMNRDKDAIAKKKQIKKLKKQQKARAKMGGFGL